MKTHNIFVLIIFFIAVLLADNNARLTGYIQTDNRIRTATKTFSWNENRLNLILEGSPSSNYHYFSEIRLRGFGFPEVNQFEDLQIPEKNKAYKWGLEFREAYVDIYGFVADDLDIRIGRQIIAWGTADALNPTNNLCPNDLEDIFVFGEKLGVNAMNATYYFGDNLTVNTVFIPVFSPATLPTGEFSAAFNSPMDLPPGMILNGLTNSISLPDNSIEESSQFGLKAATNILGFDISGSYFNGRSDLPIANQVTITALDMVGNINISTNLVYPTVQVLGMDFAGSIASVGVWGEAGLFSHKAINMQTIMPSATIPGQIDTVITTALNDESYLKYVVGGDYTFRNGIYCNFQFLHGFLHERSNGELNDYFTFQLEKRFFDDRLKIVPFGGALTINNWDDASNNYGFVFTPQMSYYPSDNVEIITTGYVLEGKDNTLFGSIKNLDEIQIMVKVSF